MNYMNYELIHELNLTNHPSFQERLNCGTHCHLLLSLIPTICHLLNLTSTDLILSPFLLKLPLIFSVFALSGLCYRPYGLSPRLLTKNKILARLMRKTLNSIAAKKRSKSIQRVSFYCALKHFFTNFLLKVERFQIFSHKIHYFSVSTCKIDIFPVN